jgi:aconitase B
MGLLTVEKKGKKNIFSGRILEIEGLGHLKCEQVHMRMSVPVCVYVRACICSAAHHC